MLLPVIDGKPGPRLFFLIDAPRCSAPNFPLTRARLASDTESPVFTELAPQTAVPRNQCAFTTGAGRDTGEQGHDGGNYPCLSKRRAAETKMHFHNSIM